MTLDADHSMNMLELKEVFCYYATDRCEAALPGCFTWR